VSLDVADLHAGFPGRPVLHGVSLRVDDGECVALLGLNGSGMSVLARAISVVVPVSRGRITIAGRDVTSATPTRRVRAGLHHLSQRRGLVAELTVAQNLRLARLVSGRARAEALDEAGRGPWEDRLAGSLSGGEQARVAIARAVASAPRVLIADEPTAGLSSDAAAGLLQAFDRLRAAGTAILLIEQNLEAALAMADRVVVLRAGEVALDSPAAGRSAADHGALLVG
jgi:ABC-type branched-subunit amino acid transport system ATPase component